MTEAQSAVPLATPWSELVEADNANDADLDEGEKANNDTEDENDADPDEGGRANNDTEDDVKQEHEQAT